MMSALASRTSEGEACVLLDGRDAFDPYSAKAAGVKLDRVLWARCRNIDQALRATDLVLHAGGFGLVALDLGDIAPELVGRVPLSVWFRFRRAVEHTPTIFLVLDQQPHAKTCASLILWMERERAHWSKLRGNDQHFRCAPQGCLYAGTQLRAEIVRSRAQPGPPVFCSMTVNLESQSFAEGNG